MAGTAFVLAPTAFGPTGFVWSGAGICGLALPEPDAGRTRRQIAHRFPKAVEREPPRAVAEVIKAVAALLDGARVDLSKVELDLDGAPPFHRRVYEAARGIGWGETSTYGTIASDIGEPGAARAVGVALGRNPIPIIVPCHRIVAAGGGAGGFTAPGGVLTKLRLLAIEGAAPAGQPDLFVR